MLSYKSAGGKESFGSCIPVQFVEVNYDLEYAHCTYVGSPCFRLCMVVQDSLPEKPLSGMTNKFGSKVRLHFRPELEQLWIGTKGTFFIHK